MLKDSILNDTRFNSYAELQVHLAAGIRRFVRCNFDGIDLEGAEWTDLDFVQCTFTRSNLSQSRVTRSYFGDCRFMDSKMVGSRFTHSNLHFCDFAGSYLSSAGMKGSSFVGSVFAECDLKDASFINTHLQDAVLSNSNLIRVDFQAARMLGTDLHGSVCTSAVLNRTVLAGVELSALCRATLEHRGPSIVDYHSIIKSKREPRLKSFLRATGMPELFIDYQMDCAYALSPLDEFKVFHSVFISYGGPDEDTARRVYNALAHQGVFVYFFPNDAPYGEGLDEVMFRGVNEVNPESETHFEHAFS